MKGMQPKKAMFAEIGRKLISTTKPHTKRQSQSFASGSISNHPHSAYGAGKCNQTQAILPIKKKISQPSSLSKDYGLVSGINDEFLFMRKQNYLNTKFNIRKSKLKEISKENKQLYERIGSQKSLYSSSDLNKSFEGNNEIKKRLSQSKLSQRLNSSRSSQRSKNQSMKKNRFQKKKQENISIKAMNINKTQQNDLKGFKALFNQESSLQKPKIQARQAYSFNSHRTDDSYLGSSKGKIPARKSIDTDKITLAKAHDGGGLLHRIAEQMLQKPIQAKTSKASYTRNKKLFNF